MIHGKELEVEYQKNNIIDSINSFFGYNCINQIKLKIIDENVQLKKNNVFNDTKNCSIKKQCVQLQKKVQ